MKPFRTALLLFLIVNISTKALGQLTETDKLYSLCKVWGFLKYYHPAVAKGKLDWDAELFKKIYDLKPLQTKEEISKLYINWIKGLGTIKHLKHQKKLADSLYIIKTDTSWLYDKNMFTDSLITTLSYVYANYNQKSNHYIKFDFVGRPSFIHEETYDTVFYPKKELSLLALFRYWNCINYFFPYKNLMDENWDTALVKRIPDFVNTVNAIDYYKGVLKLTAGTNDSHSFLHKDRYHYGFWGYLMAPVECYVLPGKAIITSIYNDSLARLNNLQYGDAILSIDGKDIPAIIEDKCNYIASSNEWTLRRDIANELLKSSKDSLVLTIERNGKVFTNTIKCYKAWQNNYNFESNTTKTPWCLRPDSIGYINVGNIKDRQIFTAFRKLKHTKAIIIDARNYPTTSGWFTSRKINNTKVKFVKMSQCDKFNPGSFKWGNGFWESLATKTGKHNNKKYYKGKIVLLVDENTQSAAEFQAMSYQTSPNIITVGGKTAGADGDVVLIPLPGGIKVGMSSIGVYYPDGTQTQRCGIKIDIEVYPTVEGIRGYKDEVLDRALEYIKMGK